MLLRFFYLFCFCIILYACSGSSNSSKPIINQDSNTETSSSSSETVAEISTLGKFDKIHFEVDQSELDADDGSDKIIFSDFKKFVIDDDVVSFILQLQSNHDVLIGISELIDPNGKEYVTGSNGSLQFYSDVNYFTNLAVASVQFPNESPDEVVAGEWKLKIFTVSKLALLPEVDVKLVTRNSAVSSKPEIQIQPILSSTKLVPADLEVAFAKLETELKVLGFEIDIAETKVAKAIAPLEFNFDTMGRVSEVELLEEGSEDRINVFFVDQLYIPGGPGTSSELKTLGVTGLQLGKSKEDLVKNFIAINISAYALNSISNMGGVVAHELGHCFGLRHTSEKDGKRHDTVKDTHECTLTQDTNGDGIVDGFECANFGGDNFMFWLTEVNVIQITEQQFLIMQYHPLMK